MAKRIVRREDLVRLAQQLGVRDDWHEPDEQGVTAVAKGNYFDNAGFWPEVTGATTCERYVEIRQGGQVVAQVNLATLLAWASRP